MSVARGFVRWTMGAAAATLAVGIVGSPVHASTTPTVTASQPSVGDHIGEITFDPSVTLTASGTITQVAADSTPLGVKIDYALSGNVARAFFRDPTTVGRAKIKFTVTMDGGAKPSTTVGYAVSGAAPDSNGVFTNSRYLYRSSDLSSAIDVGGGYILAVASHDNFIGLYQNDAASHFPIKAWNAGGWFGTSTSNLDIEAMARAGSVLFLIGSHSNDSAGNAAPRRKVVMRIAISGSGSGVTLKGLNQRTDLGSKLAAWDNARPSGHRLGFAAAQKTGISSDSTSGFNIEGAEFGGGSSDTAYLAFRAPLEGQYALLLRIKLATFMSTGSVSGTIPYLMNLGGRTIRELRLNPFDHQYLISAVSKDIADKDQRWALYRWDGGSTDAGAVRSAAGHFTGQYLPYPDAHQQGPWETIVPTSSGHVTLISDDGSEKFYGDSVFMSDEPVWLRKSFAGDLTY